MTILDHIAHTTLRGVVYRAVYHMPLTILVICLLLACAWIMLRDGSR